MPELVLIIVSDGIAPSVVVPGLDEDKVGDVAFEEPPPFEPAFMRLSPCEHTFNSN